MVLKCIVSWWQFSAVSGSTPMGERGFAVKTHIEMVQPGWQVYGSDGVEIGIVASIDEHSIVVRKPGFLGDKDFHMPRDTVADVEEHRVELNISKHDVDRIFG
jgi:hypothetical protein